MKKLLKDPIVRVVGLVVVLSSAFGVGNYLAHKDEEVLLRAMFQLEFDQEVEIESLDSRARKNRELVIWETLCKVASYVTEDEARAKVLKGDENTAAKERARANKDALAKLLDLAWRFGQFENADQTQVYKYWAGRVNGFPEPNWETVLKSIRELRPE